MRLAFVGHACRDVNVIAGRARVSWGGGVLHGGITAARLGAHVTVLTRAAPRDRGHFAALAKAGVEVSWLAGDLTTSIRNLYPSEDPDARVSSVVRRAAPFSEADLTGLEADVVHVNPLVAGELPAGVLAGLARRFPSVCADAQGFLRHAAADGRLETRPPESPLWLEHLDLLKADAGEALALTGSDEPREASARLVALGVRSVLLTHREGVLVRAEGRVFEAPFSSCTLEGRTGRGDTCTAAFLVARSRCSMEEATRLAARVTSTKMCYRGPYRGD